MGNKPVRFSLYLSSQLLMGLLHVYAMKSKFLFDDVKRVVGSIDSLYRHIQISNIDLPEPSSGFLVTFDEPDFNNVPIDFGSFTINDRSSPPILNYEYFLVSTPRSSPEEWHFSPGPSEDYRRTSSSGVADRPGDDRPGDDRPEDPFTARPEDVTLPEAPILLRDLMAPDVEDFREGFDAGAFQDQMLFLDDELMPEPDERMEVPETGPEMQDITVQPTVADKSETPVAENGQQIPDLTIFSPDSSATSPPLAADVSRHRSIDEQSRASTFVLEPITVQDESGRTRRRRRPLIVDKKIEISLAQIKRNVVTSNTQLCRAIVISSLKYEESAESMLSRFGLSTHNNRRRFWPYPKTLPEPNDPSPFGHFTEEEPAISRDVLAEDTLLSDVAVESGLKVSREEARAESTYDDTHGLSSTQLSSRIQSLRHSRLPDESSSSRPSLLATIVSGEDTSRKEDTEPCPIIIDPLIPEVVEEPVQEPEIIKEPLVVQEPGVVEEQIVTQEPEVAQQPEIFEEPEVAQQPEIFQEPDFMQEPEVPEEPQRDQDIPSRILSESFVCPLDLPPPLSPEVPSNPLVVEAISLLREAFEESIVPNQTTFSSILRKLDENNQKRRYVAKLFYLILDFHAAGIIFARQEELPDFYPGITSDVELVRNNREIYISKGPNFYAL